MIYTDLEKFFTDLLPFPSKLYTFAVKIIKNHTSYILIFRVI